MVRNKVGWARDFMRSLYPDLNDKKYALTVETYLPYDQPGAPIEWVRLTIGEGPKGEVRGYVGGHTGQPPGPGLLQLITPQTPTTPQLPSKNEQPNPLVSASDPQCPPSGMVFFKQILEGRFWFDGKGYITNFVAIPVDRSDTNAFAHEANSHPGMTQAEAAIELKALRAKYGPNDRKAFIQDLPLSRLERFLGKLEVASVDIPEWSDCNLNPDMCLNWMVNVKATRSDGTQVPYRLGFDELTGHLWLIEIPGLTIRN